MLNKLNIIDKHRLLVTVGSAFQSLNLGADITSQLQDNEFGFPIPKLNLWVRPKDNLFPLKAGDKLFVGAVDEKPNKELQFRLDVVFNESGVSEGDSVVVMLTDFSKVVAKTVSLFSQCLI